MSEGAPVKHRRLTKAEMRKVVRDHRSRLAERPVPTALVKKCDTLRRRLFELQKAWKAKYTVGASVPLDNGTTLGFKRQSGGWQIAVQKCTGDEWRPLWTVNLKDRIDAMHSLPALEEALQEAMSVHHDKLDSAAGILEALLNSE